MKDEIGLFRKILFVDMKRAFTHPRLYVSIIGVTISIYFALQDSLVHSIRRNNDLRYLMAINLAGFVVSFVFCSIPYSTVLCEDLQDRYIRPMVIRCTIRKYVLSKVITAYISAVAVMVIGTQIFLCIDAITAKEQFLDPGHFQAGCYGLLVQTGHISFYSFITSLQQGMLAGTLVVAAMYVSLFTINKAAILSSPLIMYQLLSALRGGGLSILSFSPTTKGFEQDWQNAVAVCALSFIPVIILTFFIEREVEKRIC